MASLPLKSQYGPTLGQLLAPRWRSAARPVRALLLAAGAGLFVLAVWAVLSLLPARYSHGGQVPFSFTYKGLYRTAPEPGGYVKVARSAGPVLRDSFAVAPLQLGPYAGSVTAELPLVAAHYAHTLTSRFPHLRLEGEGKTRISSTLGGYEVLYSILLHGRKLYGRDVMLLPERPHVRHGVVVEMLSDQPATVSKPVASSGVLEAPLKTFAFG